MGYTGNTDGNDRFATYIEMAKAMANLSYQGVFLLRISVDKFIYTSDYPLLRCGFSEEQMLNMGMNELHSRIPDSEKTFIANAGNTIMYEFNNIPIEYRQRLSVHFNFHIHSEGRKVMVCHKLQLLDFGEGGKPGLILGVVSPSVHGDKTRVMACIRGTDYTYSYSPEQEGWVPVAVAHLSEDELTMLRLSMQGYSMEEIGALMFRATETIKFYRRQVFLKLNVKNIPEAVAYATHYCLI